MTRILLTLAALALFATTADAGPLRNWLAGRKCQPCQQPQQVQYQPAPQTVQPTYTQPMQQVAYYQPAGFAPVVSGCTGGVCPVK